MKPSLSAFAALAALLVIGGLAGCKPATSTPLAANSASSGTATTDSALPVIGRAPAWKLKDLDGKEVSFADFKGKVVVVDFWATWCPPCREEIPGYVELQKKHGEKGLVIVGVSLDQAGPGVVKKYRDAQKVNYPLVMGDEAIQSAFGGLEAIPTTFLIDRDGNIRDKKVGAMATEKYEELITPLL